MMTLKDLQKQARARGLRIIRSGKQGYRIAIVSKYGRVYCKDLESVARTLPKMRSYK